MNSQERPLDRALAKIITNLESTSPYYNSPGSMRKSIRTNKELLYENMMDYIKPGDIGLDIGGADGMMSDVAKDTALYSLDPYPQIIPEHHVDFVSGIAESLPFPNSTFHYITILYSLHHFQKQAKSFHEAVRVLKPSGFLFIKAEFPRYHGQERLLNINERLSNHTIYPHSESVEQYLEIINYLDSRKFGSLVTQNNLTVEAHSVSKCLRWFESIYKSQKNLFILQKPSTPQPSKLEGNN